MYLKLVTKVSYYVTVTMEKTVQRCAHLSMKHVFPPKTREMSKKSPKKKPLKRKSVHVLSIL